MVLLAHDIEGVPRTADVKLVENIDFNDMFFPQPILKGLKDNGFKTPSPIQYKAIPLARCGIDLIVQSKSGTGKTLVFVLSTLEIIDTSISRVQAIVLTPTREIAVQVAGVYSSIGCHMKDLCIGTFIGGLPLTADTAKAARCHVAIGAPGRVKHLVETGHLNTEAVRLFVLDEADQLMGKTFQPDINFIYWKLKENKQMIASSATYTEELVSFLSHYMRMGKLVTPDTDPLPVLRGLTQFCYITERHADQLARIQLKLTALLEILSHCKFNQCVVFSNYQSRGESAYGHLKEAGWAVRWVCGSHEQSDRQAAIDAWTSGRVRILVSTNLTARGIDSREADLVINLDPPWDPAIYLHRMGRAARYGTYGVVITVLSEGHDVIGFRKMLGQIGGDSLYVLQLPKNLDGVDVWDSGDNLKKIYGIPKKPEEEGHAESSGSQQLCSASGSGLEKPKLSQHNFNPKTTGESKTSKSKLEFVHRDSSFPSLKGLEGSDKSSDTNLDNTTSKPQSDSQIKLSYSDMVKDKAETDISSIQKTEISSSDDDPKQAKSVTQTKLSYSAVVKEKSEVTRKRSYNECADECIDVNNPHPKFVEIIKGLQNTDSDKPVTQDNLNDFFTKPDIFELISFSDIVQSFNSFVKSNEGKENVKGGKNCQTRQKNQSKEEVFKFKAKPNETEVNEHLNKKAKVLTESHTLNSPLKGLSSPRKELRGRQRIYSDEKTHKDYRYDRKSHKEIGLDDKRIRKDDKRDQRAHSKCFKEFNSVDKQRYNESHMNDKRSHSHTYLDIKRGNKPVSSNYKKSHDEFRLHDKESPNEIYLDGKRDHNKLHSFDKKNNEFRSGETTLSQVDFDNKQEPTLSPQNKEPQSIHKSRRESHQEGKIREPLKLAAANFPKYVNTSPVRVNTSYTQTFNRQFNSQASQSDQKMSLNKQTQSSMPRKLVPKPRIFETRLPSDSDDSSSASEGTYIVSQFYTNSSNVPKIEPDVSQNVMSYANWHHMFQTQLWHIQNYVYFMFRK